MWSWGALLSYFLFHCSIFSYSWDDYSSPIFLTLWKFNYFNLYSIFSTLTIGYSWKYDDEILGSLSGGEPVFPSLSFLYFWTYLHSLHKVFFWELFYLLCARKKVFRHSPTYLINPCANFFAWRISITMITLNTCIHVFSKIIIFYH